MKKLILSTLFLPVFALANSTSYLTLSVGELTLPFTNPYNGSVYLDDVDGYAVSFSNVDDDKTLLGFTHLEATGDADGSISGVSAAYAFDSFSTGSMYVGIGYTDSDLANDTFTGYSIGYAKVSGDGTDFNLNATTVDGLVSYSVSVTADSGLSFGITESNATSIVQVGYRFAIN